MGRADKLIVAKLWRDLLCCAEDERERDPRSVGAGAFACAARISLRRFEMSEDEAKALLDRNDSLTAVRYLLFKECEKCPACGGDVADEPDDNILLAWLGGATLGRDLFGGMCPAWVGHLKEEWRQQP